MIHEGTAGKIIKSRNTLGDLYRRERVTKKYYVEVKRVYY